MRRLRFYGILGGMLLSALAANALTVRQTIPPAQSEVFRSQDTLRIRFDRTPPLAWGTDIVIRGDYANYSIVGQWVRGDTLLIKPGHYWLAGDHVTVTLTTPYVSQRYQFGFTVKVTLGSVADPWIGRSMSAAGMVPRAMCAVDLDGDGPIELVGLGTNMLGYARNVLYDDSCGGACVPFNGMVNQILPDPGYCDGPRVLRAGDLNGDGKPDLVVSDFTRNTLVIYHNISEPRTILFGPDTVQIVLGMTAPRDFVLADLNADGWLDIAAIGTDPNPNLDRLEVFLNNHSGGFLFTVIDTMAVGLGPTMLGVGDVNGDHLPDLVVSCAGQRSVDRYTNTSSGAFTMTRDTLIRNLSAAPDGVILGNLYWDNLAEERPDFLVWSVGLHTGLRSRDPSTLDESPYLQRFRNNGFGLDPGVPASLLCSPLSVTPAQLTPALNGRVNSDWVVIGDSSGVRQTYFYSSSFGLIALPLYGTRMIHPLSVVAFDADLDGDIDLFFADQNSSSTGSVTYYINPDSLRLPATGTMDFHTIPVQCVREDIFYYHNNGTYPAVICTVAVSDDAYHEFSLAGPATFPQQVMPADSLALTFRFSPCYSVSAYAQAQISLFGAVGGCHRLDLSLFGTGGRARIGFQWDSSGVGADRDTFDIGFVDPNSVQMDSLRLKNTGNWPLNARIDASRLQRFTWFGPDTEFVSSGGATGPWHAVEFRAPPAVNDTVIKEWLLVRDSVLCHNTQCTQDTFGHKWICLKAHVLRNTLPAFECPRDTLCEGDTGTIAVRVWDPNPYPSQPVVCAFNGVSSDLLSTTPAMLPLALRNELRFHYDVRENVAYPSETCSLRFIALDNQFPERSTTMWCVLHVCGYNDPPWIVPRDTTIYEGDTLANWVCARAMDEEGDALAGSWQWLPPLPGNGPVVTFNSVQNIFRINWRPDYHQGTRTYALQMQVWARADTTARDTAESFITVRDRPANLLAQLQAWPDTLMRNRAVRLDWRVYETLQVPVDTPFTVRLRYAPPLEDTVILMSRAFPSLAPGDSIHDSLTTSAITWCGPQYFELKIFPALADVDSTDNQAVRFSYVRCPDVEVASLTAPWEAVRGDRIWISFVVRERAGLPFETTFLVALTEFTHGDTLWSRPRFILAANQEVSDSVPYVPRSCSPLVFRMTASPFGDQDANLLNNTRSTSVQILCPDLAAENLEIPAAVHRNQPYTIRYTFAELNGVPVDSPIVASVSVSACGQSGVLVGSVTYPRLAARGVIRDSLRYIPSGTGAQTISLRIYPPSGADTDPDNNCLEASILCFRGWGG